MTHLYRLYAPAAGLAAQFGAWLDPAAPAIIAARDALAQPSGAQAYNMLYPLHAAKVGGLAYRLVMTATGLVLLMLGLFASWSFWFRRSSRRP